MTPQFRKSYFFEDNDSVLRSNKRKSLIPADSPEILYAYYFEKMLTLKTQLNKLNLLDHPCEIQAVCNKIILAGKKLGTIATKYKIQKTAT